MAETLIYDVLIDVLEPILGRPLAVMCIRSIGVRLNTPAEELGWNDFPRIQGELRKSLRGVTTTKSMDVAIREIEARAV